MGGKNFKSWVSRRMCAGAAESVLAVTPSERIKTALIDDVKGGNDTLKGFPDVICSIARAQGVKGLYGGLLPTTIKQASTSAVRMGSYSFMKETTESRGIKHNSLTTFLMGSIAGVITVYTTQSFDSIKTRAQALRSAGTLEAFKSIVADHGVKGFWRGSTMRLGRLIMGGGIVFTVYEKTLAT